MFRLLKINNLMKTINVYQSNQKLNTVLRKLSTSVKLNVRIAICGCSGGVGQPLCLILKTSPLVKEIALFDVSKADHVEMELSHINTKPKQKAYTRCDQLEDALENKDIIVIAAGQPRKKGMKKLDTFEGNAGVVQGIVSGMVRIAPRAILIIVTNPVDLLVPIAAEVLKKGKVYNPNKLFGNTTIDSMRASSFLAELLCIDPSKTYVPVAAGHTEVTCVPIFSQADPKVDLPPDTVRHLTERVQNAGTNMVEIKGSATLSAAFAAARFIFALCRAMKGESDIVEPAYVQSDLTDAKFFATPLLLGPEGIKKSFGFGKLNDYECCLMDRAVQELVREIKLAEDFLHRNKEIKK